MDTDATGGPAPSAAGGRGADTAPQRHRRSRGAPPFDALLVPVQRAFAAIGCCRTKGYELVAEGKLVARKDGGRTLIEAESLRAYAAGLPTLPVRSQARDDLGSAERTPAAPVPAGEVRANSRPGARAGLPGTARTRR